MMLQLITLLLLWPQISFAFRRGSHRHSGLELILQAQVGRSRPPLSAVDAVLAQCRSSGNYSAASSLATTLENELVSVAASEAASRGRSGTVTSIIRIYGELGDLGRALATLNRMQPEWSVVPCEHHFGALIQAARRAKQCDMALELFGIMTKRYKIKSNTIVYNSLIMAAGEAGRLELVLELLSSMDTEGVPRDAFTYSGTISACEQQGNWQRALQFYEEMVKSFSKATGGESSTKPRSSRETAKPTVVVLNTCLKACVTGRQWKRALELLVQAKKELGLEPDAISYSLVITACGNAQEIDLAQRIFTSAVQQTGNSRAIIRDTGMCNAMLTAYERSGTQYWREAVGLLQEMLEGRLDMPALNKSRPDSKSFATVITACGKAGEWQQCMKLYDQMGALGVPKDRVVYNSMINALQAAGQWERAKELLLEGKQEGVRPSLYSAAEIFELTHEVYSQGVVEGMFQHWASPLRRTPQTSATLTEETADARANDAVNDQFEFGLSKGVDPSTSVPFRYMDLHAFPVSVAKTAVSFVIEEMTEENSFDLRIITGRGNHINSSGERGVLRAEIEGHIASLLPPGLLQIEHVEGNDGVIVLKRGGLISWIREKERGRKGMGEVL